MEKTECEHPHFVQTFGEDRLICVDCGGKFCCHDWDYPCACTFEEMIEQRERKMSCKCCCDRNEAVQAEVPPRPRYHVSASKNSYVSESFDDLADAVSRIASLIAEGYAPVSLRDNEVEGSW